MAKKAMVYIQSGGPTSVINSSLYGAIKEAQLHEDVISHIYGSLYGIEGLLCDELIDLGKEDPETIELLKQTPGSILGTSRHKLPKDYHDKEYQSIIETLKKHNIGFVFVNGGNDSMDTCFKLSALCKELGLDIKVMGVPKTVDNDLAETDHSNGFGSAAKYIVNTVKEICIDASCYKRGKVFIIEIMGRNAGWLTAAVDVLPKGYRPDFIYLPENKFDVEKFLKDIKVKFDEKGFAIAAISEGITFERDESNVRIDSFGHKQLGGAATDLAKIVETKLDLPARAIELSLPQRAYCFLTSKVDQDETIMCGRVAVQKAIEGMSGRMIAIKRISDHPYAVKYEPVDISKIANVERIVPQSMMKDDSHMAPSFSDYCLPLIQGEIEVKYENGIIKAAELKKVRV
jgi:ATP-dependent phosphofructokinase / diphosphate-dependent phosphofructokinase